MFWIFSKPPMVNSIEDVLVTEIPKHVQAEATNLLKDYKVDKASVVMPYCFNKRDNWDSKTTEEYHIVNEGMGTAKCDVMEFRDTASHVTMSLVAAGKL